MLVPATASASHSVFLDSVSPMQARCQVKGLFGLPSPKAANPGLPAGAYLYAVTAIVDGAEVVPACPYLRVPINGTASQDAVLLQWNATPGAAAYRVYRGTYDPNTGAQLTQPVQLLTGAPFNAYPANCGANGRCITQDRGAAPAAGPRPRRSPRPPRRPAVIPTW